MLQINLIGNIGAAAEVKNADGREFVTFRVAHNESFNDAAGHKVERSMWVDCTMSCNGGRPAILPFLQAGTLVFVQGSLSTRVYSSAKDRCMKAGLTIHVTKIELLGGTSDTIPRRLFDNAGVMHDVTKFYAVQNVPDGTLQDQRGREYCVENGWVTIKPNGDDGEVF